MKGRCLDGEIEWLAGVILDSDMVVDGGVVQCMCVVINFCYIFL